jgi:hypothetical protein
MSSRQETIYLMLSHSSTIRLIQLRKLYLRASAFALLSVLCAQLDGLAQTKVAAATAPDGKQDVFEHGALPPQAHGKEGAMPPDVVQLVQILKLQDTIAHLEKLSDSGKQSIEQTVETLLLRQKLSRSIQYASLELEEALANIDGDLTNNNLKYAYYSAKRDRKQLMTGVGTFVGSGTMGVLDSGLSFKLDSAVPHIFGVTGNALSVGLPLLALRATKYKDVRHQILRGNMLAPIFGRPYTGEGYDPIIWAYLETVPAESGSTLTRRQMLVKNWQRYRGLSDSDAGSKALIDELTGYRANDTVSVDMLKLRSDLLVDLRALIQQMYRDISNLNTAVSHL